MMASFAVKGELYIWVNATIASRTAARKTGARKATLAAG